MALTKKEYDALGEAEYMIDDALVVAAPITFGGFCKKYDFDSKEDAEMIQLGIDMEFLMTITGYSTDEVVDFFWK